MTDGGKCALDWVCGPQVFPMFGGKVVEGEQRVTTLGNALGRFLVLAAVGLDEDVKSGFSVLPSFRHPDVVQRALGLGVQAVRQPAALSTPSLAIRGLSWRGQDLAGPALVVHRGLANMKIQAYLTAATINLTIPSGWPPLSRHFSFAGSCPRSPFAIGPESRRPVANWSLLKRPHSAPLPGQTSKKNSAALSASPMQASEVTLPWHLARRSTSPPRCPALPNRDDVVQRTWCIV
jgi:hypothetical protein